MQDDVAQVAARIRERRETLDISQEEAARRLGVSNRTWARWEAFANPDSPPTNRSSHFLSRMPDIAKVLETTRDDLIAGLQVAPPQISLRELMEELTRLRATVEKMAEQLGVDD